MVEPMQENDILLAQNQEYSIKQLRDLGKDEHNRPKSNRAVQIPLGRIGTHGVKETLLGKLAVQVGHQVIRSHKTEDGEQDVPDCKHCVQRLGFQWLFDVGRNAEDKRQIQAHGENGNLDVTLDES